MLELALLYIEWDLGQTDLLWVWIHHRKEETKRAAKGLSVTGRWVVPVAPGKGPALFGKKSPSFQSPLPEVHRVAACKSTVLS